MMYVAVLINDPNKSILSRIVQVFTKSVASHVELVFSDGTAAIVTPQWMTLEKRKDKYDLYHWVMIPLPEITETMEKEIRERTIDIYKDAPRYDYLGAVSGYFRSCVQNESDWYCGELVVELLREYIPELEPLADTWATPELVWKTLVNRK